MQNCSAGGSGDTPAARLHAKPTRCPLGFFQVGWSRFQGQSAISRTCSHKQSTGMNESKKLICSFFVGGGLFFFILFCSAVAASERRLHPLPETHARMLRPKDVTHRRMFTGKRKVHTHASLPPLRRCAGTNRLKFKQQLLGKWRQRRRCSEAAFFASPSGKKRLTPTKARSSRLCKVIAAESFLAFSHTGCVVFAGSDPTKLTHASAEPDPAGSSSRSTCNKLTFSNVTDEQKTEKNKNKKSSPSAYLTET